MALFGCPNTRRTSRSFFSSRTKEFIEWTTLLQTNSVFSYPTSARQETNPLTVHPRVPTCTASSFLAPPRPVFASIPKTSLSAQSLSRLPAAFPDGINNPLNSFSTTSGIPQVSVVITGIPVAIASSNTDGNPSISEGNKARHVPRRAPACARPQPLGSETRPFKSSPKNSSITSSGTPHPANVIVNPGKRGPTLRRASRI